MISNWHISWTPNPYGSYDGFQAAARRLVDTSTGVLYHAFMELGKYRREKGGDGSVSDSGHKHWKGEKEVILTDNHGLSIGPKRSYCRQDWTYN